MAKRDTLEDVLRRTGVHRLRAKHGSGFRVAEIPSYKVESAIPLSNDFAKGGFRRDPLAHRWKQGAQETPETVREIERKAKSVAVAFNKGGYQFLTPDTDPKTIGRK